MQEIYKNGHAIMNILFTCNNATQINVYCIHGNIHMFFLCIFSVKAQCDTQ